MARQPSPSVLEQTRQATSALADALTARLAAEIAFDRSDEAIAAATGGPIAAINALTCGRYRQLDAAQEAQVDLIVWQPVAESCISAVLHVLFDEARDSYTPGMPRFIDEDLTAIVNMQIAAPFQAKHFGLDDARRHRAAELTAELFRDRSRFAQPTPFTQDGDRFTIHRDGDALVVQAL